MDTVIVHGPYETRILFDYCFSAVYLENTVISKLEEKTINRSVAFRGLYRTFKKEIFALHVETKHGPAEIWLKEKVFRRLKQGNRVKVRYQVGRWSGSIKAKLAS